MSIKMKADTIGTVYERAWPVGNQLSILRELWNARNLKGIAWSFRMVLISAAAIALALLWSGAPKAPAAPFAAASPDHTTANDGREKTGTLIVKVTDEDGQPVDIESVQLWIRFASGAGRGFTFATKGTGTPGVFRVRGIPVRKYTRMTIHKSGFAPLNVESVHVGGNWDNTVVCTLVRGGTIEGYVTDELGKRAGNIPVSASTKWCTRHVRADNQGRFRFEHLPDGDYTIYAQPDPSSRHEFTRYGEDVRPGTKDVRVVLKVRMNTGEHETVGNGRNVQPASVLSAGEKKIVSQLRGASVRSRRAALDLMVGKPAPPLIIQKWYNSDFWRLNLSNRVVLLHFWGVWCGPCKLQIPLMNQLVREYGPRGLVVVGIHTDEQKEELPAFLAKSGLRYPIAVDHLERTSQMFRVSGYPTIFLIDRKGIVIGSNVGTAGIKDRIEALLRE